MDLYYHWRKGGALKYLKPDPHPIAQPRRKSEHQPRRPPPTGQSNSPRKYKVVKELGDGGGGCNAGILIVRSRISNKVYIEKKIPADWVRSGCAQAEVNFLKQLRGQAHTVDMVDYIEGSLSSVFFEYCEWGSMTDLIDRHQKAGQNISEKWLWKAFKQMATAIDFCHNGPSRPTRDDRTWYTILHLDLKPDNVLLKVGRHDTPDIIICDFGAAMGGWQKFPGSGARTTVFRPPEYEPSNASDVWCIGTIMVCACYRDWEPRSRRDAGLEYTPGLSQAIYACMRINSVDRVRSEYLARMLSEISGRIKPEWLTGVPPIRPRDEFEDLAAGWHAYDS